MAKVLLLCLLVFVCGCLSNASEKVDVAVLGAGLMGRAIVKTLEEKGKSVVAWSRSYEKTISLASNSVRVVKKASEATALADITLITVVGGTELKIVTDLLEESKNELKNKVVVVLSSAEPDSIDKVAEWCAQNEIKFSTGAMIAIPQQIGTPESLFLMSGKKEYFEIVKPTLELLCYPMHLGEKAGLAAVYDFAFIVSGFFGIYGRTYSLAMLKDYPEANLETYLALEKQLYKPMMEAVWQFQNNVFKGDHSLEANWFTAAADLNAMSMWKLYLTKRKIKHTFLDAHMADVSLIPENLRTTRGPSGFFDYLFEEKAGKQEL